MYFPRFKNSSHHFKNLFPNISKIYFPTFQKSISRHFSVCCGEGGWSWSQHNGGRREGHENGQPRRNYRLVCPRVYSWACCWTACLQKVTIDKHGSSLTQYFFLPSALHKMKWNDIRCVNKNELLYPHFYYHGFHKFGF